MKMREAQNLRDVISHEISILSPNGRDRDSENVWVVTKDCDSFFVMYFDGDYETYSEQIVTCYEEWERNVMSDKQKKFNPNGEWAHRRIVSRENDDPAWPLVNLECGHSRYLRKEEGSKDETDCYICRRDGVGWSDELMAAEN